MPIMATEDGVLTITVEAGSAITKNRFIKRASDAQYDHVGVAQAVADGISAEAASGAGVAIAMKVPNGAVCIVEAGAAMATDGVHVASDNAGRCIAYTDSATNIALGRLMGTAGAAGEYVQIQFYIIGSNAGAS